jgi:hypothetical protein
MPAYSDLFDPPAPVAFVTLRHPATGQSVTNIPMLMDTGSDITLVPLSAIKHLGIAVESQTDYQLVAFDGTRSTAPWAELHLLLLSSVFRGRYVVIDQDIGVLGRDILNLLVVVLDGPGKSWEQTVPNRG